MVLGPLCLLIRCLSREGIVMLTDLTALADMLYTVIFMCYTGHTFRFSLGLSILSVQSLVPQTEKGKVLGLLGTYNDDPSDDITASDGTLVCNITTNCDDKTDIHQVFGESCKYYGFYNTDH